MYKSTIFNWNIFNCPLPSNLSIYIAPEVWLPAFNNKRAAGIKLDTETPSVSMTTKIEKVYRHHKYEEIAVIETQNSKYYLYGPPDKNMINYLEKNNYDIPEIWSGERICYIIRSIMQK